MTPCLGVRHLATAPALVLACMVASPRAPALGQSSGGLPPAALQPPASPCANNPENRRFDFWVGRWSVTTQTGTPVGTSHVDVISGGCALLENWRAVNGAEGKSINTLDPATHKWRQFWVGQGGIVTDYADSEWHDGSISFFVRYPAPAGKPATVMRLTFTPVDSTTVRQHSEISSDGEVTWKTQYDFYYHRQP